MNKNEKYVITINRELGSGGRTVGRKLAEKLNVAFYDKALINELKKKFKLDTEQIEKLKSGKSDWWREFINSAMYMGQGMNEMWYYQRMTGQEGYLVTSSDMFKMDKEILRLLPRTHVLLPDVTVSACSLIIPTTSASLFRLLWSIVSSALWVNRT